MGDPILVIGASLAGWAAVAALRDAGHDGDVVVVDGSTSLPSDRPPLSKQVLAGEWEPERAVQPLAHRVGDLGVDLRLGAEVVALGPAAGDGPRARRVATLADGTELAAAGVVVATGATPRTLPGELPAGVHVLRTLEDCLALRADLDAGPSRVVVIGAGFIGAEVAATCRGRGLDVTMVEATPLPMQRVLPGEVGGYVAELHRDHGVDVRLGVGVAGLDTGPDGRVRAVHLADGTEVPAQVVVVGIGVVPQVGWLDGSGVPVGDGVECDATLLAAPGVVAAGDVARWPNEAFGGEPMRVEHWEHAIEQGEAAGRRLLDDAGTPFGSIPWFWSDQYDRKLQLAGRPAASDEVVVVDGDPHEGPASGRRFVVAFRRRDDHGDRCTAVLGVNRPRLVVQARMRLGQSLEWGPVAELLGVAG